jgi:hypothetical protein
LPSSADAPPAESTTVVVPQQAMTTVYVWTGVYAPPLVVFPIWHPYYHYYWYHRHPYYGQPPGYHSYRYNYAYAHRRPYYPPSSRPPTQGRPPSQGPPAGSGRWRHAITSGQSTIDAAFYQTLDKTRGTTQR